MDENVTNIADHLEFERGVNNSEQTRYITWRMEQEGERNQSLILQPVSGNGAGRKGKGKIRMEGQFDGGPDKRNYSASKIARGSNRSPMRGDGKAAQSFSV